MHRLRTRFGLAAGHLKRQGTLECRFLRAQHSKRSLRWPPRGRAHRKFLNGVASGPAHQYSFVTISDQPRRPDRDKVKISMTIPCLELEKLWRSRSNSTPSCVQRDRFMPGFVLLTSRSNIRKNEGRARLLTALCPHLGPPRYASRRHGRGQKSAWTLSFRSSATIRSGTIEAYGNAGHFVSYQPRWRTVGVISLAAVSGALHPHRYRIV